MTFGGGITIEKTGLSVRSLFATKSRFCSHDFSHFSSVFWGSYLVDSCDIEATYFIPVQGSTLPSLLSKESTEFLLKELDLIGVI